MAIKIEAMGQSIKIHKAFVSGRDRVTVDGQTVFEGKLTPQTVQTFEVGERQYTLEMRTVSKMIGAIVIHLNVSENGELKHSAIYDQSGKPVEDESQSKSNAAMQICLAVGAGLGVAVMLTLNMTTGVVPGGAIGGAIGAVLGALVGAGVGGLIFGKPKQ
ncbi:MAG: hypothetical protein CMJ49_03875 [Planctomycetaceae bacterium]|nr:hypothetical protein [Planctomycetaceae bacterium]